MKAILTFAAVIGIWSSAAGQIADGGKFTAADILGKWMGVHPEWIGVIVFYPDGNFVRPHTGTGRWELVSEGAETKLVMFWHGYRPSTSTMVSVDHFSEAGPRGGFHIYRVPPPPIQAGSAPSRTSAATATTKARFDNSRWRLAHSKNILLNEDGSVTSSWDPRPGTWKVIAPDALVFDVPWQPAPAKVVTTTLDATILRWTDDENILGTRQGN
jgi:hypothetical protein